jgi:hypothetical protein
MADPIIEVTRQLGVGMLKTLPARLRIPTYAVTSGGWRGTQYFDADGRLHVIRELVPPHPIGFVQRLLAATIHNPWLMASIHYEEPVPYEIPQLVATLIRAVEADDDILTQWREPEDLLNKLRAAKTFKHCVATLHYAGVTPEPADAA